MKTDPAAYWREIASGHRKGLFSLLLMLCLLPASQIYALIQSIRAQLYRSGVFVSKQLPCPVISVGNITVGGTGKTPVTAWLADLLLKRGLRVAVLTRGYGGSLEGQTMVVSDGRSLYLDAGQCGDEPYLLASRTPGLIVMIGANRHAAGMLAMEKYRPDVFLLDDGFQHLRLCRDLNILLLDAKRPFGNGMTLPAGLLREPLAALGRADLVIHTRCPDGTGVLHPVDDRPNFAARHLLGQTTLLDGSDPLPLGSLVGRKVLALAGIAEPGFFFTSLRAHGLNLVATLTFGDHAAYGQVQLTAIIAELAASNADCLITTAKDAVKLSALVAGPGVEIRVALLELGFDEAAQLADHVINSLQK